MQALPSPSTGEEAVAVQSLTPKSALELSGLDEAEASFQQHKNE